MLRVGGTDIGRGCPRHCSVFVISPVRNKNDIITQSNFRFINILPFHCFSVLFGPKKVHTFDKNVSVAATNPLLLLSSFSNRSKRKLNTPTGSIIKENINAFDRTGDTSTSTVITNAASADDYIAINAFSSQFSQPPTNVISTNNYIITASHR